MPRTTRSKANKETTAKAIEQVEDKVETVNDIEPSETLAVDVDAIEEEEEEVEKSFELKEILIKQPSHKAIKAIKEANGNLPTIHWSEIEVNGGMINYRESLIDQFPPHKALLQPELFQVVGYGSVKGLGYCKIKFDEDWLYHLLDVCYFNHLSLNDKGKLALLEAYQGWDTKKQEIELRNKAREMAQMKYDLAKSIGKDADYDQYFTESCDFLGISPK